MMLRRRQKKNRGTRMAKVGDRVRIMITGPGILSNATTTTSGNISIPDTASPITVGGRIIREVGDDWIVELDVSIEGNRQMLIPKAIVN